MPTDVDAIKAILHQWVTAINAGRAHTVRNLVSDDVVLRHPPSTSFAGKDTVARLYRAAFNSYDVYERLQYEDIRVVGSFATARVVEHLTVARKGGGEVVGYTERDAMLFRRHPDRTWKLASRALAEPSRWLFPQVGRLGRSGPKLPSA